MAATMPYFGVHSTAKTSKRRYWLAGPLVGLPVAALMIAMPQAAFAATPVPLGTAATFGVLATAGITNTGVTTIQGDTGSLPTNTTTGFGVCSGAPGENCVTQTGTNYTNPANGQVPSAQAALTTAYNAAAGQTPTAIAVELGGQRLVAGVYSSGTLGMTGTLTLDGQGDHGAVFIFQAASTLITSVTGHVLLINGAQECNVFWQIGSSATLVGGSDFTGTIAAHDSISVLSGVTVHGRLLAGEGGAGAVTLIHDTILKPTCNTTNPVIVVRPPAAPATPTPAASPSKPAAGSSASVAAASASAAAASRSAIAAAASARAVSARVLAAAGGNLQTGITGRAQVLRVPVGAVQSGDGSMSRAHHGSGGQLVLAGAAIGCAALVGSAGRMRRLRRRQG